MDLKDTEQTVHQIGRGLDSSWLGHQKEQAKRWGELDWYRLSFFFLSMPPNFVQAHLSMIHVAQGSSEAIPGNLL